MVNSVNAKKGDANTARVQSDQKAKRDAKVQQRRAAGGAAAASQAALPKQQTQSQPKPQPKQKQKQQQQKAPAQGGAGKAAAQQQKLKPKPQGAATATGKLLGIAAKRAQLKLKGAPASAAARQPKTLRRAHVTVSGGAAGGKKVLRARPLSIQSSALTQRSQLRALVGAAMPPIKVLARNGPNARGGAAVPPAAAAMMLMNGLGGMAGMGAGAPHMFAQQLQLQQLVLQQQQQLAVLQQQQQQFAQSSKQAAASAPKAHAPAAHHSAPKTARAPPKLAITISNSDALTAPVHHAPAPAPVYSAPAQSSASYSAHSHSQAPVDVAPMRQAAVAASSGRTTLSERFGAFR